MTLTLSGPMSTEIRVTQDTRERYDMMTTVAFHDKEYVRGAHGIDASSVRLERFRDGY